MLGHRVGWTGRAYQGRGEGDIVERAVVSGRCAPGFEGVRAAFERNFSEHGDVGASVAVTVGGEPVVDLWGGHTDRARTRAWERDTLVNVYSTSKGMTALCAHLLVERGELDLNARWPGTGRSSHRPVRGMCPCAGWGGRRRTDRAPRAADRTARLRLGGRVRPARGHPSVVGAGYGAGVSRGDVRIPRGRGCPSHHRAVPRHVPAQRDHRAARGTGVHRHTGRGARTVRGDGRAAGRGADRRAFPRRSRAPVPQHRRPSARRRHAGADVHPDRRRQQCGLSCGRDSRGQRPRLGARPRDGVRGAGVRHSWSVADDAGGDA